MQVNQLGLRKTHNLTQLAMTISVGILENPYRDRENGTVDFKFIEVKEIAKFF